ncbi:putative Methyltransferase ustM [Blattamonas nauphoetae]|uniref:Methyltransferase ustM n=1 Tax=Blattamonas nauphoetae TaxID=2049346 RepID=A0ABQ9Y2E2_9EUKA|nr:putative Methyltransferase ustM [Blattamonas nauphoetae]
MTDSAVSTIIEHMLHDEHTEIQAIQTAHRLRLIDTWDIQPGEKILEIGSGQGDMLAALAYAVGPTGHVTGVDIASPDYGSPYTIGQAIKTLTDSDYGDRLTVFFERDLTKGSDFLAGEHFNRVILAHSLWYFDSLDQLATTIAVAKTLSDEILLAEWDFEMTTATQQNHYIAASVQGQLSLFNPQTQANIRTLVTKHQITAMAQNLNLKITAQGQLVNNEMQDGAWEVAYVKDAFSSERLVKKGVEPAIAQFLADQVGLINGPTTPLNTFWFRLTVQ